MTLSITERLCIVQRDRLYDKFRTIDNNPERKKLTSTPDIVPVVLGYISADAKLNSNWMYDLVYDVVVKEGELPIEKERKDVLWKLSKKINTSRPKSIWWDRERIYKSLLIVEYLWMKNKEGYKLDLWDEQGRELKDVDYI